MATEHATAVREREQSIAAASAAVIAARSAVVTARLAVEPLLRALRLAEGAARKAESDQEHAVLLGNKRVRETLTPDELYALHCWALDLAAEHDEQRNQLVGVNSPMSARKKNRIAELHRALTSVKNLELAEDPVAEIKVLRAKLRVPVVAWVRDQPGDPPPEPVESEERSSEFDLVAAID